MFFADHFSTTAAPLNTAIFRGGVASPHFQGSTATTAEKPPQQLAARQNPTTKSCPTRMATSAFSTEPKSWGENLRQLLGFFIS